MWQVQALCVAAVVGWALCASVVAGEKKPDLYGADANPTGDPIGGGPGYRRIVEKGDFTVKNADEFLAALNKAQAGQVVYVAPDAKIDLTGHVGVQIPAGVTLAGNRGKDGSNGPLIFTQKVTQGASFLNPGEKVRITGLRIKGPDPDLPDTDYNVLPRSWMMAVLARSADIEVDNCEISNFHHSGVNANAKNTCVHHNFIHDVHAYPVCVAHKGESAIIEANIIHWVWHSVAGSGDPGTGYEARYNIVVRQKPPKSWGEGHKSHGFDMHGFPVKQPQGNRAAGDRVSIHHNTMLNTGPALSGLIRGTPRQIAEVYNNWFSEADPALGVSQVEPHCNLWVYNNVYGPDKTLVPIAAQSTPRIQLRRPPPPTGAPVKVSGKFALDLDVTVLEGLQLQGVVIELDQKQLYSGPQPPKPSELAIDTSQLADGDHKLTVKASDNRNVTAAVSIVISVAH